MKLVLDKLIGEGQSSFVPNRNITDNIILVLEIAHTMRQRKGESSMAIKIDLKKAYDMLRWEFIEDTLREAHFPDNFIKLTLFGISLVSK